ncbi:MAG TPA: membrane protein insertase YidC [Steroidobacteraceae bacterium]|nr:membrane protein insertase YidC [Steroidobacteraceae bacterium]
MGNLRVLLWVAFGLMLYLNYETWNHDYAPVAGPESSTSAGANGAPGAASSLADRVPSGTTRSPAGAPGAATAPPGSSPAAASAPPGTGTGTAPTTGAAATVPTPGMASGGAASLEGTSPAAGAEQVHVKTDVLDLSINLAGGSIDQAALPKWPLRKDAPNVPVVLENPDPATLYVLQSGLIGANGEAAPTHKALWSSAQSSFTLDPKAATLAVPLTWSDGQGLTVTKTFLFKRGGYAIGVTYEVHNAGATARHLASYAQLLRRWEHPSRSYFNVETYSFKGPEVFDGTKTKDLNVESETDSHFKQTISNGWLAALQHHFVSAIVPPPNQPYDVELVVQDHLYQLVATGPFKDIATGGHAQFTETLFIGPKLQDQLKAAGPQLERTVDYGKLYFIAQPLFTLLSLVERVTGNWGLAIIIVTAMIKLVFYPLSQASGRSMAKMRAVAPRMKQIQETYKDDREKLGRAMMELYKREKINPLTGCLPMVVQIPFFFSFYWVLLESVEMRQAPFMLWINDLSSRDPIFVLPALMGIAMFGQFKLNPPPPDPMQAKIMQFMPLVMTATMMWFPAGLVLYWLTNTVLSIAQQWRINQVVQAETAKYRT